jgi:histidinol-phosphate aminotransferase
MERPVSWTPELLEKIYASVPADTLQQYPDPNLFYKTLAVFLNIKPEELLLTSGIDEAIRSILTLYCEPGDDIVVTAPGYAMYKVYSQIFQLNMTPIHFSPEHFLSPEEIVLKIPDGAKIIFLANPSQPVENCYNLEEIRTIINFCADRDILCVIDEAYHFFGAETAIHLIDEFPNILVLRSFSKAFGAAALRLGYVVGVHGTLEPLSSFRLAHEANSLSLHVGKVLVENFDCHIKQGIDEICKGRDYLREITISAGFRAWGKVGNFVLIELSSKEQLEVCLQRLTGNGVYVKGVRVPPLDHHILVTCGGVSLMKLFFAEFLNAIGDR